MIENLIMLASYSFGGAFGNLFNTWEQLGFFDYVLPFLLIFALVFGILSRMNFFDNKSVNGLIAFSVGLMALQSNIVSTFFSELFPRFGVGLAIILLVIIFGGLFIPDKITFIYLIIGAVVLVGVLVYTAGALGWSSGYDWGGQWPSIVFGILLIVLVARMMFGSDKDSGMGKSGLDKIINKIAP